MESEIKMLKEREVDQKNQASGYETLLRDGIPLNEHFLALKNKYNNEKDEIENECKLREQEIEAIILRTRDLKTLIESKKEFHARSLDTYDKTKQQNL